MDQIVIILTLLQIIVSLAATFYETEQNSKACILPTGHLLMRIYLYVVFHK